MFSPNCVCILVDLISFIQLGLFSYTAAKVVIKFCICCILCLVLIVFWGHICLIGAGATALSDSFVSRRRVLLASLPQCGGQL